MRNPVVSRQLSVVRCPWSDVRRSRRSQSTSNVQLSSLNSQLSTLNHQPSTFNPARGFTLIEVIVALALSVILLVAVYGAINLTYKLSTAGREQMEQAQLVRALFQKIDADVRSVVFFVPADVASTSGEAAEEDEETETEPLTTDEAFANASNGVYGDSQNLVLHVSRPSRLSVMETTEADAAGRSDLAAVSYFLAVQGGSGLPGMVAQMAQSGSLLHAPRMGTVTGLTRLEGDRLSVQFAEETGDIESLASAAHILANEVVSLNFAFWDGLEWTDTWNTIESGALPAAIEITLGIDTTLKDSDDRTGGLTGSRIGTTANENQPEPTIYRHVVALPLAEPYVGEL